jgi:hypothetical protein
MATPMDIGMIYMMTGQGDSTIGTKKLEEAISTER